MALPAEILGPARAQLDLYCENRIPEEIRDQIQLEHESRGNAITLLECRPPWRENFGPEWTRQKIAQFRYDPEKQEWTLFWHRASGRWHRYDPAPPAPDIGPLLAEVAEDRMACFWG